MIYRHLAALGLLLGTFIFGAAPASATKPEYVRDCSGNLEKGLDAALKTNGLFGQGLSAKYTCLKFSGDALETVIAYLGDISAKNVSTMVPLATYIPVGDIDFRDLTLIFSPPLSEKADQGSLDPKDIQAALTGGKKLAWEPVELQNSLNLVAGVDLSKTSLKTLFEAVGMRSDGLKRWTLQSTIGLDVSGVIKSEEGRAKHELSPERTASATLQRKEEVKKLFGVNGANLKKTKMKLVVSQEIKSGAKPEKSAEAEGTLTYKGKSYDLFAHSAGALALDTNQLTLKDFLNAAELSGKAMGQPWAGLSGKLKLPNKVMEAIKFTKKTPACREMALTFSRKMIAAAKSGDGVPDDIDPACSTDDFVKSQHQSLVDQFVAFASPAVTVNGALDLLGKKIAQANVSFSGARGLDMDIALGTFDLAGLSLKEAQFTALAENPAKGFGKHKAQFTGKASILDVFDGELTVGIKNGGYEFSIPANCPLIPTGVTGSTGSLDSPDDFNIAFELKDCYSEAIIGAIKDPKKLVKLGEDIANESIDFANNTVKNLGSAVVNADKTWKNAWKASVDVGQTAVKAVKVLDKSLKKIGQEIIAVGKLIEDLANEIKKLTKKIAETIVAAVTGKLEKKRKAKKKEKKKKKGKKLKLASQKARAQADRDRASAALGKLSPVLDPKVIEARDARADLLYEKKLADARKRYAKQLKKDIKNSSKRKALFEKLKIDVNVLITEQLEKTLEGGSLYSLSKAGSDIKKQFADKRTLVEKQVMAAILEKAMDDHLKTVKRTPENTIPYDTEVRLIGKNNLCIEAYVSGLGGIGVISGISKAKLRAKRCIKDKYKKVGKGKFLKLPITKYRTQRFLVTPGGKFVALFGKTKKHRACFQGETRRIGTTLCKDSVNQIFFFDPTIDAIRPLDARGKNEPRCLETRWAARVGSELQLKPCAQNSKPEGKKIQTWRAELFKAKLPKKIAIKAEPSMWRNYGKSFRNATSHQSAGVTALSGLIKIVPYEQKGTPNFSEPIDILPKALRPQKRLVFNVNTHTLPSRIDVLPNGRVLWIEGNKAHKWASLDGITFATKGLKSLKIAKGCKKYPSKTYAVPGYAKSGSSVILNGLVKCSFSAKARNLATLPKGARPAKRLIFNVNAHERSARVDVLPDGRVQWHAGGGKKHGWVSLNGIAFYLAGAKKKKPVLAKGCKAYGGVYTAPSIAKVNGVIRLSGMIKCPFGKSERNLVTLPKGYRPSKNLIFDLNIHDQSARVDVLKDGRVRFKTALYFLPIWKKNPPKWISLDGISYPVKGSSMALKW